MDMGYVKILRDLKIDASLGKEERILSYLEQMENPMNTGWGHLVKNPFF